MKTTPETLETPAQLRAHAKQLREAGDRTYADAQYADGGAYYDEQRRAQALYAQAAELDKLAAEREHASE